MSDHHGAGLIDRGIRITDGIVRRPRGYWTDAVHALLMWLDAAGYAFSPTPIGLDAEFEYVQFIEGADVAWPMQPFIQSRDGARTAGAFARALESVLAPYQPAEGTRWLLPDTTTAGTIQHGDLGPWNLLWDGERGDICGVIDWDLAGPGPEGYDAGLLAWQMVPMMDDDRARERGFDRPINRADRLRAFSEGYGMHERDMLDRIVMAQEELRHRILSATEDGPPIYAMLKQRGLAERIREDIAFTLKWREYESGSGSVP